MLNVVHVFSDTNFIYTAQIFKGWASNTIILIKDDLGNSRYPAGVIRLDSTIADITRAIDICAHADLVVLYGLNGTKSYIANRLPKKVQTAWFFYGYELYKGRTYYSELTLAADSPGVFPICRDMFLEIARKIRSSILKQQDSNEEFNRAVRRIDYFLCLSRDEYDLLKSMIPELPQFVQRPYESCDRNYIPKAISNPVVVLGNSKSPYNNHLDLIQMVSESENAGKYRFVILFNYGEENRYAEEVRKSARKCADITLIEQLMPREEFRSFYSNVSALVINSYRQMAVANVLEALRVGAKIYLNKKNIVLQWLKSEGFKVFPIEDLPLDLKCGTLRLSSEEAGHNQRQFSRLSEKYSIDGFQKNLYSKILANTALACESRR